MATKIVTKNSSTASAVPTASDLVQGELAVNVADKRLFTENNAGAIVELGTNPSALTVDGNVGIGTSSPAAPLSFGSADNNARIYLRNNTNEFAIGTNGSQTVYAGYAGHIFQTGSFGGTERMRIDASGNVIFTKSGGAYLQLKDASAVRGAINVGTSDGLMFTTGASFTERMRIDSAGNVGIGNSSPVEMLTIGSTSDTNVRVQFLSSTTGANTIQFGDGTGASAYSGYINYTHSDNVLAFATGSSERMQIDGSGRLGLGVTPEAWSSVFKVLRVGTGSSIAGESSGTSTWFSTNAYYDGSWKRINTNTSAQIAHTSDGKQEFKVAALGSTGSAISWNTAMTVDNSGNVLVGKTTTGVAGAGTVIRAGGELFVTRAGDVMNLNRLTSDGEILVFRKDGVSVGSISTNANSLPSDRNFKKNITDLTLSLDFVKSLSPKTYNFKIDDEGQAVMAGLIAQEVEESLTAAGVERNSMTLLQHEPTEDVNESDYKMDYVKFVPVLINAIKEQQTLIESLTDRIAALEE